MSFLYQEQESNLLVVRHACTAVKPQDLKLYKNKKPRISTRFMYQERESNPHGREATRF